MSIRIYSKLSKMRIAVESLDVVFKGEPLDDEDRSLFRLGLCLQGSLLYDICPPGEIDCELNKYYRWLKSLRVVDSFEFGNGLKLLTTSVRRLSEQFLDQDDKHTSWMRFTRALPAAYRGFLAPVRETYRRLFDDTNSPGYEARTIEGFSKLLQWCEFLSKLTLRSADLENELVAEYDQQEQEISHWTYDTETVNQLADIVYEWFSEFPAHIGSPKHGPGATAEVTRREACPYVKDKALHVDEALLSIPGPDADPKPLEFFPIVQEEEDEQWRSCELVFVPKGMTTRRVISKEPTALAFMQQGLKENLYEYIGANLRQIIDLSDQTKSQTLARVGSRDGSYATIDLSAASDSVSLRLVEGIFSKVPGLLDMLKKTRSQYATYKEFKWKLGKFAPMGSAACFPVECIVFASICELSRRRMGSRKQFRVYGDDICCPNEYAHEVISLLERLHFKVNEKKSYFDVFPFNFREACGGEYLNGTSVSPVRLSRGFFIPHNNRISVGWVASVVGLCNQLYKKGLWAARSYMLCEAQLRMPKSIFNTIWRSQNDDRFLLQSSVPENEYRYELDKNGRRTGLILKRSFIEVANEDSDPIASDPLSESLRLREWFRRRLEIDRNFEDQNRVLPILGDRSFRSSTRDTYYPKTRRSRLAWTHVPPDWPL